MCIRDRAGQVGDEVEEKVVEGGEVEVGGDICWRGGEDICWKEKGRKEIKEKENGKEMKWEDIFLVFKDENIRNTDSRDWVVDAEIFRENTGIVRNSSISERPEINIKNP